MFSTDRYFGRSYLAGTYNCAHFAADVWLDLTGQDLKPMLCGLLPETGKPVISELRKFKRMHRPADPCLVLYTHPVRRPHAGVYVGGRVIHLSEHGVQVAPVDMAGLGMQARFYSC